MSNAAKPRRLGRLLVQASADAQDMLDMLSRQQVETLEKLAMAFRLVQDMTDEHARLRRLLRELRSSQSLPSVKRKIDAYLESIL